MKYIVIWIITMYFYQHPSVNFLTSPSDTFHSEAHLKHRPHQNLNMSDRTFTHFPCNLFFRYHLQDNNATEDFILHSEPNHTLRWNHISNGFGFLSTFGLWGEGYALRLDFTFPYGVFLAFGWDNPTDFISSAFAGKVFTFYYDPGHFVDMGHRMCT